MKALLTIIAVMICTVSFSQKGFIKYDSSKNALYSYGTGTVGYFEMPRYAAVDTVKCLYLWQMDSTGYFFQWQPGFIVRSNGLIAFGRTSVSPDYLPMAHGIVTSPLFDAAMRPIRYRAISVILTK